MCFAPGVGGCTNNNQLWYGNFLHIWRIFREEKVEEMTVKKYDAKQSAEALQRVVLVRVKSKRAQQGCAASRIWDLLPAAC